MGQVRQGFLAIFLIIASLLVPLSAAAQSSAQVSDLLRQITVRIHVEDVATGSGGLCHGFVSSVRYEVAYVVTAKHCVEDLAGRPLTEGTSLRELNLSVTVEYANETRGTVRHITWSKSQDALVLVTSFGARPTSYAGLCSGCRNYRTFGTEQRLPVESVLSAGGGPPVISSGMVLSDSSGRYVVMLPSSPGTSGSPVLDLQGNLVGIVVTGAVYRGAEASWVAGIVPGSTIVDLVRFAVEHYESTTAQSPTPAPPNATPGLPAPPIPPAPTRVAPSPSTSTNQFLITPGQGIGGARLGTSITDVTAILGRPKVTLPYSKTSNDTIYSWFEFTNLEGGTVQFTDGGLMLVCSQAGQVKIIQAYYAPQYVTAEGLHTGVTEDQVRAAFGEPARVERFPGYHSLEYLSQGITFRIGDDPQLRGYRTVFLIKIYPPQP
jgi:Trypsin-like peptidase domain